MQLISEEGMKNIDKVQKQKSKLSIQQLDETLLILYDRLTRINKYPVKDLNNDNAFYTDGVYTDDGSGIFYDFCMKLKDDDKVDKDSKSVLIDQVGRNWYNNTRKWEKILVLFLIRWFRHIVTFEPSISSVQTPSK